MHLPRHRRARGGAGRGADTLGRGYSEELQAHSCKPGGGDVHFTFLAQTGQIASVEFDGRCMTLSDPQAPVAFGLRSEC